MQLLKKSSAVRKQAFIGVRVQESTKRELELLCKTNGLTISAALEQIIVNYINYSNELQNRLRQIKNVPNS